MARKISGLYVEFGASTQAFLAGMEEMSKATRALDRLLKPLKETARQVGDAMAAGLTVPLLGIGAAATEAAIKIEEGMNSIRVATGATGSALEGLGADFRTVLGSVPNSIGDVSKAIGDLSTRTGLAGAPLQQLATQELNLARITKTDLGGNIAASTRLFASWNIAADQQSAALDYVFKVSQKTGIGVAQLNETIVQSGAPLRALGFSFQQAAVLLGQFEKEGINADKAIAALRFSMATFAKAGQDPQKALAAVTGAIRTAKTETAALSIGLEVFGKKASVDLVQAIRAGRLDLDALTKTIGDSHDSINEAAKDTLSFAEKLDLLKNKAALALEPVGSRMIEAFDRLMPRLVSASNYVADLAASFSRLPPGMQDSIIGFAAFAAAIGPALLIASKMSTVATGLLVTLKAIGLVTGVGGLATAGVVALGVALGVGVGALTNWATKAAGLQGILDGLARQFAIRIPLLREWVNGNYDAATATTDHARALGALQTADQKAMGAFTMTADATAKLAAKQRAAADAGKATYDQMKAAEEEQKRFSAQVKELTDSIVKQSDEGRALTKAIQAATAAHVSMEQIVDAVGKKVLAFAEAEREAGRNVNETIGAVEAATRAKEELKKQTETLVAANIAHANSERDAEDAMRANVHMHDDAADSAETLTDKIYSLLQTTKLASLAIIDHTLRVREMADAWEYNKSQIDAWNQSADHTRAIFNDLKGNEGILASLGQAGALAPIPVAPPGARPTHDVMTNDSWARYTRDGEAAVNTIVGDMSRMFTDSIAHGKSFWQAFKGEGANIAGALADTFFSKMLHNFLDPFHTAIGHLLDGLADKLTGFLSGLLNSLSSKLGGIFGKILGFGGKGGLPFSDALSLTAGGVFGTAAGGVSLAGVSGAGVAGIPLASAGTAGAGGGASALALATNPVTIAAAGAIGAGLLIKHYVGKGRRTANEFVQGTENPFGSQLTNLVDTFNSSNAAGSLTLKDAQTSRVALTQLIDSFKASEKAFASQGKTENKVGEQSLAHFDEIFGKDFSNIFKGFDDTIANLKNTANPASTIPNTGLANSASSIFSKAVDRFTSAVEDMKKAATTAAPITVTVPVTVENTFNVSGSELGQTVVLDTIMPEITDALITGARSFREKWTQIFQSTFDGISSSKVATG